MATVLTISTNATIIHQGQGSLKLLSATTLTSNQTNNNIWAIRAEGTVTVNGSGDFDGAPLNR